MTRAVPDFDGYAQRWAGLHGGYDPRGGSVWVRGWLRGTYAIGAALARRGVGPSAVTLAGLLLGALTPLVAPLPRTVAGFVGAAAVLVVAAADSVDGAVAIASDRVSRGGYVLDSVADRVTEAGWLCTVWLLGAPGPVVVAAGALGWLHEYVRARAAGSGMRELGAITLAERPMRILVAIFGLLAVGVAGLIGGPALAGVAATVTAAIWAVLSAVGLTQMAFAVRRALR